MITVFTPAYNRGHTIERLFHSLQLQSNCNFEWIVIDDGSIDNTEELFSQRMMTNNQFNIIYKKVINGGKHRAINSGVEMARGELFFIVDSDDWLKPNSIEKIYEWEAKIKGEINFIGISGLKERPDGSIIGRTFKGVYKDSTNIEREKNNILGDKAEVFYTNLLKRYKFPEFKGENFITESVVWDKMALDGYKIRYFNEAIYVCEYLDDGLSAKGSDLFLNNPDGTLFSSKQTIGIPNVGKRRKIAAIYHYYIVAKSKGKNLEKILDELKITRVSLISAILTGNIYNSIKRAMISKNKKIK